MQLSGCLPLVPAVRSLSFQSHKRTEFNSIPQLPPSSFSSSPLRCIAHVLSSLAILASWPTANLCASHSLHRFILSSCLLQVICLHFANSFLQCEKENTKIGKQIGDSFIVFPSVSENWWFNTRSQLLVK